jgi:protease-4
MSLETEAVIDRRRLRRRLAVWRSAAVVALAVVFGLMVFGRENLSSLAASRQIARVAIEGAITDDRYVLALFKKAKEAKHVEAVLVFVNSPGGTTTGGEVARGNTITGSVGVLAQWPELTGLLDKVGVKMNEVKSGELKAAPSPFSPATEEARRVMQETIDDGFRWFVSLVEERRGIAAADVPGLLDGRIYSGRQALEKRLVDAIGGEREAVRWLEEKRGVPKDLDIVNWKPERETSWGLSGALSRLLLGGLAESAGRLGNLLRDNPAIERLGLDGLVSVWQPSEN